MHALHWGFRRWIRSSSFSLLGFSFLLPSTSNRHGSAKTSSAYHWWCAKSGGLRAVSLFIYLTFGPLRPGLSISGSHTIKQTLNGVADSKHTLQFVSWLVVISANRWFGICQKIFLPFIQHSLPTPVMALSPKLPGLSCFQTMIPPSSNCSFSGFILENNILWSSGATVIKNVQQLVFPLGS